MSFPISSAGLVYVYFSGYEHNGLLSIQTMDSYRCLESAFYRQAMKKAAEAEQQAAIVHVFAILGLKEKTNNVYQLCQKELEKNFQRILEGKRIQKSLQTLDHTGNAFFRCIQEFFCEQPRHFPKRIFRDYEDFTFSGIYCSALSETEENSIVEAMVSLWAKHESPYLYGRQLMIRSFFLRGLVGRKVIACIPEMESGIWGLVFEGGRRLFMDRALSYGMETIYPEELHGFSSSNIQTILMNPIYAYGLWFQPNDLCEEWHKVFLYLCAVSEYSWDEHSISRVYEKFLNFLQDHICILKS